MWHLNSVGTPNKERVILFGGLPDNQATRQLGDRLGPEGAVYTVTIFGVGYLQLADIGASKGGPGEWAVRVNDSSTWYYNGEGQMAITVNPGGTFAITGGSGPTVTGTVIHVFDSVDVRMDDAQYGFAYHVQSPDVTKTSTLQVPGGVPYTQFSLLSPSWRQPCSCATLTITGPSGLTITKDSPPRPGVLQQNGPGGLIFARITKPAPGTYTATVDCKTGMPWYLGSVIHPYGLAFGDIFPKAYAALPPTQAAMLIRLGILVPPPGVSVQTILTQGPDVALPEFNWHCAACQAELAIGMAILAAALWEFLPAWFAYVAMGSEVVGRILDIVSNALDVNEATAKKVVDTLATILDPTSWPGAICRATGICQ